MEQGLDKCAVIAYNATNESACVNQFPQCGKTLLLSTAIPGKPNATVMHQPIRSYKTF